MDVTLIHAPRERMLEIPHALAAGHCFMVGRRDFKTSGICPNDEAARIFEEDGSSEVPRAFKDVVEESGPRYNLYRPNVGGAHPPPTQVALDDVWFVIGLRKACDETL